MRKVAFQVLVIQPSQMTHFSETNENTAIYKIHQHQHIPEIEQALSMFAKEIPPITFTTHLVPMTRGILATSYAPVSRRRHEEQLVESFEEKHMQSSICAVL